jgi:hypothetical protein
MVADSPVGAPKQETLARLARAAADFAWIMGRVTPANEPLSMGADAWNILQVLAHMVMYEERYCLPSLRLMATGQAADRIDISGTESDLQVPSADLLVLDAHALHARLRAAESARDALVHAMTEAQFTTPLPSVWGHRTPQWIVEKSFGHIWEHGTSVFYITHFADVLRKRLEQARATSG